VLGPIRIHRHIVEPIGDIDLGYVDGAPARVGTVDLEQEAAQRITELHCFLVGQVHRRIVDSAEGKVADSPRSSLMLGDDAGRADPHPPEVLDCGEREDHGVAALAHLVRLLKEKLGIEVSGRVWAALDRTLQLRRCGRRSRRQDRRAVFPEVLEVRGGIVRQLRDGGADLGPASPGSG